MPGGNEYVHGDYNVICDRSGFKVKRSECRREWTGLLVRKDLWEPRHPQERVRGVSDKQSVPDARPDATPTFLSDQDIGVGDIELESGGFILTEEYEQLEGEFVPFVVTIDDL